MSFHTNYFLPGFQNKTMAAFIMSLTCLHGDQWIWSLQAWLLDVLQCRCEWRAINLILSASRELTWFLSQFQKPCFHPAIFNASKVPVRWKETHDSIIVCKLSKCQQKKKHARWVDNLFRQWNRSCNKWQLMRKEALQMVERIQNGHRCYHQIKVIKWDVVAFNFRDNEQDLVGFRFVTSVEHL